MATIVPSTFREVAYFDESSREGLAEGEEWDSEIEEEIITLNLSRCLSTATFINAPPQRPHTAANGGGAAASAPASGAGVAKQHKQQQLKEGGEGDDEDEGEGGEVTGLQGSQGLGHSRMNGGSGSGAGGSRGEEGEGAASGGVLNRQHRWSLIGLNTPTPYLKVNNQILKGTVVELIGTDLTWELTQPRQGGDERPLPPAPLVSASLSLAFHPQTYTPSEGDDLYSDDDPHHQHQQHGRGGSAFSPESRRSTPFPSSSSRRGVGPGSKRGRGGTSSRGGASAPARANASGIAIVGPENTIPRPARGPGSRGGKIRPHPSRGRGGGRGRSRGKGARGSGVPGGTGRGWGGSDDDEEEDIDDNDDDDDDDDDDESISGVGSSQSGEEDGSERLGSEKVYSSKGTRTRGATGKGKERAVDKGGAEGEQQDNMTGIVEEGGPMEGLSIAGEGAGGAGDGVLETEEPSAAGAVPNEEGLRTMEWDSD